MSKESIAYFLLSILVPSTLSIMGGVLAIHSLPVTHSKTKRWLWLAGFAVMAIASITLGFWQQTLLVDARETARTQTDTDKARLEGEVRYAQGQLDTINKTMIAFIEHNSAGGGSDKGMSLLAKVLSAQVEKTNETIAASNRFYSFSSADLKSAIKKRN